MAAPLAAGEVALVRSAYPGLRSTKVIDHIVATSVRVQTPIPARIDAGAAITLAPEGFTLPTPQTSPSPSPSPLPTPTPSTSSFAPLLLLEENSARAAALDSVTFMRAPFSVFSPFNLTADQRTRVMLFATNLNLLPGENSSVITAQAVDSQNQTHPLSVEQIGQVQGFDWLSFVIVKLPDSLIGRSEDVSVTLRSHGVSSNNAVLGLKP